MMSLVLSLFPGIGLLDRAFEAEGFCVVRGPDLLWGGDVKRFSPPTGRFDGVIGGPPCQRFSRLAALVRHNYPDRELAEDLIPEFTRVVLAAQPAWFLMENVPQAPSPETTGYFQRVVYFNNRWLGEEQNRVRRFVFGSRSASMAENFDMSVEDRGLEHFEKSPTVCASGTVWDRDRNQGHGGPRPQKNTKALQENIRLQGLPSDFDLPGFTVESKIRAVGNGVPIPMGRAVARSIRRSMERGVQ
jgi:DNA (cytosine-5)-methyltransferase 1